jgi:hypothetical protein
MTVSGLIAGSLGGLVTGGLVVLIIGVGSSLVSGRNNTGIDAIGLIMLVVGIGGLTAWRRWFSRRSAIDHPGEPAEGRERG